MTDERQFLATPEPGDPRTPLSPEARFRLEAGLDPDVLAEATPVLWPDEYDPNELPEAALRRKAGLPEPD